MASIERFPSPFHGMRGRRVSREKPPLYSQGVHNSDIGDDVRLERCQTVEYIHDLEAQAEIIQALTHLQFEAEKRAERPPSLRGNIVHGISFHSSTVGYLEGEKELIRQNIDPRLCHISHLVEGTIVYFQGGHCIGEHITFTRFVDEMPVMTTIALEYERGRQGEYSSVTRFSYLEEDENGTTGIKAKDGEVIVTNYSTQGGKTNTVALSVVLEKLAQATQSIQQQQVSLTTVLETEAMLAERRVFDEQTSIQLAKLEQRRMTLIDSLKSITDRINGSERHMVHFQHYYARPDKAQERDDALALITRLEKQRDDIVAQLQEFDHTGEQAVDLQEESKVKTKDFARRTLRAAGYFFPVLK